MQAKMDPIRRSRLMYILQADLEYLINLLVHGTFLATLTSSLGMSDSLTGIISAFASLGCLFQMLSVFFRKGSVKRFVMLLSISNQILFILLYLIPIGSRSTIRIGLFVGCIFLAFFLYNIAHPKKIDWFMSMVPEERRGIFTANKEIISLITGIFFNFVMGGLIDHYREKGDLRTGFLLGAITLFVLSVLHSLTMLFTVDREHSATADLEQTSQRQSAFSFFRDDRVLKVAGVALFWYVSNYATTSFYGTYQIKELGFSLTFISVITVVASVARILVSKFWGGYADRNSFAKMLCWCFAVTAVGHLAMVFTTPTNGRVLFPFYLILSYIGQGGIGSALINICYDYVPFSKRSDALAFSQAIGGTAGFCTTLVVSPLVSHIQQNGNRFLGLSLYAQQVTAVLALVLDVLAIVYIVCMVLPMPRDRGGLRIR